MEDEQKAKTGPGYDWDSDEALQNLKLEKDLNPHETEEGLSRRLLRESSPQVTLAIIHTALHDPNGATRLRAGQYVIDRVLGPAGQDVGAVDPLTELLKGFTGAVEKYANETQVGAKEETDEN